jgi:sialate O-acetylesterase
VALPRTSAVSGSAFSLAFLLLSTSAARAQIEGRVELSAKSERESFLEEPVAYRVYQRDRNDRAEIAVVIHSSRRDLSLVAAQLSGLPEGANSKFADGKFSDVPTGGPYRLVAAVKVAGKEETMTVGPLFVGDLWVLGGQSNMVGYGDLIDVVPPHPKVMALGMDGRWVRAQEPLHWEIDAVDPVHLDLLGPAFADPAARAGFSQDHHKGRGQGAGLGLPFAVSLAEQTGVPIGLLTCAHGGTSMAQWSPAKKGEGGRSLYGAMLLHIRRAGGRVKGPRTQLSP